MYIESAKIGVFISDNNYYTFSDKLAGFGVSLQQYASALEMDNLTM